MGKVELGNVLGATDATRSDSGTMTSSVNISDSDDGDDPSTYDIILIQLLPAAGPSSFLYRVHDLLT
jgi:hypothetical protein